MHPKLHDYCPGNGTRYLLVITEVEPDPDAGYGADQDPVLLAWTNCHGGGKAFTFDSTGFVMWTYLAEKMDVESLEDVAALLVFMKEHTGVGIGLPDGFGANGLRA